MRIEEILQRVASETTQKIYLTLYFTRSDNCSYTHISFSQHHHKTSKFQTMVKLGHTGYGRNSRGYQCSYSVILPTML